MVIDAINRGVGFSSRRVFDCPISRYVGKAGGVAIGCLLTVPDEEPHKSLLLKRGFITGKGSNEEKS